MKETKFLLVSIMILFLFATSASSQVNNVELGLNALVNNVSGNNNVAIGVAALFTNTTGNSNTAFGLSTLFKNTSGFDNSAMGVNALFNNTEGTSNSGMGRNALFSNTLGSSNAGIGVNSLYSNVNGSNNLAIGTSSLRSNVSGSSNSGIGVNALFSNTTGTNNIGIGSSANYYNNGGSNNTLIGTEAGRGTAAHSKSGNVFIGYQAGYNETGSNLLYIDNSNTSDPLIYGNFNTDQVGIGTSIVPSDPTYKLAVAGKLISEEVRVLLQSTGWPDYVFKADYNLRSIEEVESFINDNGHLPNIPSAEVVEKEGILLGDMNKNLLEKIEELTLYMIQTNKDVKELQSENAKLKKEVEALKNK